MKKAFAFLGVGIVLGVAAYALWHKMNNEENSVAHDVKCEKHKSDADKAETLVVKKTDYYKYDVDTMKNMVVSNITARHEDAAQIMREAVDVICKRSEVAEDENNELEQISIELDNLLGEG